MIVSHSSASMRLRDRIVTRSREVRFAIHLCLAPEPRVETLEERLRRRRPGRILVVQSISEGLERVSIDFSILRDGFSVRPAVEADSKALRMLLPEMRYSTMRFVAVGGERKLVVGAAGATRSSRQSPLPGPGIAIHVIEPCRRAGIGRRLLEHLERGARAAGAKAIYGAKRVARDSDEMRAWAALGFTPCATVEEHVVGLEHLEPRLGPLVARLRQQGRVPAGARVISLYEADADAVLQLHLDNLGGDRVDLYRRLRGIDAGAFHPRYSRVLTIDGKVKGCILGYRVDKENAVVDAVIVDPSVRRRWASVWLRLEATRGALRWGIKNVQFTTFDHYADTRRFAKKLGGVTTRTTVLVMRPIAEID